MPTVLAIAFIVLASAAEAAPRRTGTGSEKKPAAQPAKQSEETARPWVALAGGPAFPFARGPVWLRSQLRVGLPLMRLDERLELSLVLPLGVGWARQQGAFSSTSTVLALDLTPSARLGARGPGRLRFYGDFGVGVAHFRYGFELPGLGQASGTSTGLALRLGAGLDYALSRQWRLFLEPLHLLFHTAQEGVFRFGNSSFTSSTGAGSQASVQAGASFLW